MIWRRTSYGQWRINGGTGRSLSTLNEIVDEPEGWSKCTRNTGSLFGSDHSTRLTSEEVSNLVLCWNAGHAVENTFCNMKRHPSWAPSQLLEAAKCPQNSPKNRYSILTFSPQLQGCVGVRVWVFRYCISFTAL